MKKTFILLPIFLYSSYTVANSPHWIAIANGYDSNNNYKAESYLSSDGTTWNKSTNTVPNIYKLSYGDGIWGGISMPSQSSNFYTSADGVSWTLHTLPSTMTGLYDIAYGQGQWIVVGNSGIYTSTDNGASWKHVGNNGIEYLSVAYNNNQWIAGTNNTWDSTIKQGVLSVSTNGVNWDESYVKNIDPSYYGVNYTSGMWMAVGSMKDSSGKLVGVISTSVDSQTWTTQTLADSSTLESVTYGGGTWIIVGLNGVYTSIDAQNWDHHSLDGSHFYNIRFSNGQWIAIGNNSAATAGVIYNSIDGETWFDSGLQAVLPQLTALSSDGQNPTPPQPPVNSTVPLTNDTSCLVYYNNKQTKHVDPVTVYVFTGTDKNPQYSGLSIAPNESVPHAPLGTSAYITPSMYVLLLGETPEKMTSETYNQKGVVGGYVYQQAPDQTSSAGLALSTTDPCKTMRK